MKRQIPSILKTIHSTTAKYKAADMTDNHDTVYLHKILYGDNWRLICLSIGVEMGEACTIVLRGATKQILDEAERSLHDALCVLTQTVKETKTVFGGGM